MSWKDTYHPKAAKAILNLAVDLKLRDKIRSSIAAILADPYAHGKPKAGPLKGCRATAFTHARVAYRIVYEIDKPSGMIYVLSVAKHDSAYDDASRRRP